MVIRHKIGLSRVIEDMAVWGEVILINETDRPFGNKPNLDYMNFKMQGML